MKHFFETLYHLQMNDINHGRTKETTMQVPVQITIRDDLPHTPAIDEHIHEKAENLQHYCKSLISCHVVLELANKNQNNGNLYNTRLTATVPKKELVSTHNENENMYASIKAGFEDLVRQLEEYNNQMHGQVKNHKPILSGKVARLINGEGFGFIEGPDGTEYYFNGGNLTSGVFDKISIGTPVHFVEFTGHEGLQAHRVKILEKAED